MQKGWQQLRTFLQAHANVRAHANRLPRIVQTVLDKMGMWQGRRGVVEGVGGYLDVLVLDEGEMACRVCIPEIVLQIHRGARLLHHLRGHIEVDGQ